MLLFGTNNKQLFLSHEDIIVETFLLSSIELTLFLKFLNMAFQFLLSILIQVKNHTYSVPQNMHLYKLHLTGQSAYSRDSLGCHYLACVPLLFGRGVTKEPKSWRVSHLPQGVIVDFVSIVTSHPAIGGTHAMLWLPSEFLEQAALPCQMQFVKTYIPWNTVSRILTFLKINRTYYTAQILSFRV